MRLRFASARLAMRPSATQNALALGRSDCGSVPRESRYRYAATVCPSISGTQMAALIFICTMLCEMLSADRPAAADLRDDALRGGGDQRAAEADAGRCAARPAAVGELARR